MIAQGATLCNTRIKVQGRHCFHLMNKKTLQVTHLHVGFEDTLMLESGRILRSTLILALVSLLGTGRVTIALDPFSRKDLVALESESLFGLFAGERPIVSTRLGPLVDSCNGVSSDGWRIMLDRLLAFSLRIRPTFERRREFLDCVVVREADVGRRRVGLASWSLYFGICRDSIS